jgi:hypothetical protein
MILLHLAQLGVTVGAHDYAVVCVCPTGDVMEFEAARVGFDADDAGAASVGPDRSGIGALLTAAVPANDRRAVADYGICSELKATPVVFTAGTTWAVATQAPKGELATSFPIQVELVHVVLQLT